MENTVDLIGSDVEPGEKLAARPQISIDTGIDAGLIRNGSCRPRTK